MPKENEVCWAGVVSNNEGARKACEAVARKSTSLMGWKRSPTFGEVAE